MAKVKPKAAAKPTDKAAAMRATLSMQGVFRKMAAKAMPGAASVGEGRRPAATESDEFIETSYVFRWGADADRAMLADLAKSALSKCGGETGPQSVEVIPITEPDFCVTMTWKKQQ